MIEIKNKDKVLYPELSYKIIGVIFEVYNKLGYGYREKNYYKAIEEFFLRDDIKFQRQLLVDLKLDDKKIGRYYLDYLIEDSIILEVKVGNFFSKQNIEQVYSYLKSKNLKLGLLVNFTDKGIKHKRILNIR